MLDLTSILLERRNNYVKGFLKWFYHISDDEENNVAVASKKHHQKQSPIKHHKTETLPQTQKTVSIKVEQTEENNCFLSIPKVTASSSSETLTGTSYQLRCGF